MIAATTAPTTAPLSNGILQNLKEQHEVALIAERNQMDSVLTESRHDQDGQRRGEGSAEQHVKPVKLISVSHT